MYIINNICIFTENVKIFRSINNISICVFDIMLNYDYKY